MSMLIRGIQTLNFSRKTKNVVLSDLQIVDVVTSQMVFQNIANLQLKGPPHFVDLLGLNFGPAATWNSATRFFEKFCNNMLI